VCFFKKTALLVWGDGFLEVKKQNLDVFILPMFPHALIVRGTSLPRAFSEKKLATSS